MTGITLARNQLAHAETAIAAASHQPRYLLQDYREHAAQYLAYYDRIISIGIVEHVGRTELNVYFRALKEQLKPGGRALIHSIVRSGKPATVKLSSPWLSRYIFPGGHIPEVNELVQHAQAQGLVVTQQPFVHESFHYAETLRRWRQNFLANYSQLDANKYDERFKRMWIYYLCMCEGMFEGCGFRVVQVLLEKPLL